MIIIAISVKAGDIPESSKITSAFHENIAAKVLVVGKITKIDRIQNV